MANSVSVVIPVYGQWIYTHTLLTDIRRYWSPKEIIIVDDCSPDTDTRDGCTFWESLLPIRYIKHRNNLGFLLSANDGIKQSSGDIIICMNNDVRITGLFNSWDILSNETSDSLCIGGRFLNDTGWNVFMTSDKSVIFPYLEGWLISATRKNWGDGFDIRYVPSDFEDVDKSTEWRLAGIELRALPDKSVIHFGAKSYGYSKEREARTNVNRRKFAEKFGLMA